MDIWYDGNRYYNVEHEELRAMRRQAINKQIHYWHDWARYYNYSYGKLTFIKNTVRSIERAQYGTELKVYA